MHVLKVPYDKGGGAKSLAAKYGPDAIEKQFRKHPWRSSEDGRPLEASFVEIEQKNPKMVSPPNTKAFLDAGERSLVVLSGDNSCTEWTARGVAEFSSGPHLAVLDAHLDSCDFSHDPHASWVRRLWEDGVIRPERTFFFGTRDPEEAEMRYVKERGATIILADELDRVGPHAIVSNLVLSKKIIAITPLVFAVDIDALDPVFAPGTGVLRSGGLNIRQVLRLIRAFGELSFPVKVGEISEVIPHEANLWRPPDDRRPDPSRLTVLAAEVILREMIHRFSFSKSPA